MFHCTRVKERGLNVEVRSVYLFSIVIKIYAGILEDRVHRVRGCVDQIFSPKWIGEKAQEKKYRVYVGLMNLEKANNENV